ncbi:MAG: DNA-methyltransferase [Polyangiales bacterium]
MTEKEAANAVAVDSKPSVVFDRDRVRVWRGDCRDVLATLADASVDAIVTDPPYDLTGAGAGGFMGKAWDATGIAFNVDMWRQCLRVLKPGGHLIAFGGTRTSHRMVCAIEDAGFEIRDTIEWLYSGAVKAHDVSKQIDKNAGVKRERVVNPRWAERYPNGPGGNKSGGDHAATIHQLKHVSGNPLEMTLPATDAAKEWAGWYTALKPAHEPAVLARKPFDETVAENVLTHGTGAMNIDACRVQFANAEDERESKAKNQHGSFGSGPRDNKIFGDVTSDRANYVATGRWPANVILGCACEGDVHDPECAVALLDAQGGVTTSRPGQPRRAAAGPGWGMTATGTEYADMGGVSRFYYCAKASPAERGDYNTHTTVKPVALMRYLCRLVTPPGGIVLDPFAGSGSTLIAALKESFQSIGIEREAEHVEIVTTRLSEATAQGDLFRNLAPGDDG